MNDHQAMLRFFERVDDLAEASREFFETRGPLFIRFAEEAIRALREGRKLLIFGNGGSAAQAQHFAAELVNKFLRMRRAYRAVALTTDTSTLTSIGNDMSFDHVFSRQIQALGDPGDLAVGLSTSGTSVNIVEALKAARGMKLKTAAMTGQGGGALGPLADFLLDVPTKSTPIIQEIHLLALHLLAEEIEEKLG